MSDIPTFTLDSSNWRGMDYMKAQWMLRKVRKASQDGPVRIVIINVPQHFDGKSDSNSAAIAAVIAAT